MAVDVLLTTQFLVVGLFSALAAWLLYLNFSSSINRVFALFLGLQGSVILLNQLVRLVDYELALALAGVRGYLMIATVPTLAYFFVVYQWRTSGPNRRRVFALVLVVGLLLELAYATDHSLFDRLREDRVTEVGPLGFLGTLAPTMMAALAAYFALAAPRLRNLAHRRFHSLLALGFALGALAGGTRLWYALATGTADTLLGSAASSADQATAAALLPAMPLGLLAVGFLVANARDRWRRAAWLILPLFVVGILAFTPMPGTIGAQAYLFFNGLARLPFPLVVAYAIARQVQSDLDPFRFDMRVRLALRGGTIGAIYVAAFFIVGEGAAEFFKTLGALQSIDPRWSDFLGIVGAGLLLFALHPIQAAGERIARSALPRGRPVADLSKDDRAQLYLEQAGISWMDGTLSIKDRQILDQLRERLGLPAELASKLERQAAGLDGAARRAGEVGPKPRRSKGFSGTLR